MSVVRLTVKDIDDTNRRVKFTQAVGSLAKAMRVPLTMKQRAREAGEKFVYQAEADLVEGWNREFAETLDAVYLTVCAALDLPRVTTFSKALDTEQASQLRTDAEAIIYKGRVVYNPETGRPIYRDDFEKIIRAIEKFLNKRLEPMGKRIVMNAVALGRVMARKLLRLDPEEVRRLALGEVKHADKTVPWLAETLERQNRLLGPLHPEETDRLADHYRGVAAAVEVAEQSMGDHITRMEEEARHAVRRSIIDGIKGRSSKAEVAQDLFNRFGSLNRDWGRIAETETVEAFNNAFLRESAITAPVGTKVYFRRVEMRDDFVCAFCERIRGAVALWSDVPLENDRIDDPVAKFAIWEGKNNVGRKARDYWLPAGTAHPWCRGSWESFTPSAGGK